MNMASAVLGSAGFRPQFSGKLGQGKLHEPRMPSARRLSEPDWAPRNTYELQVRRKKRADERTRIAFLLITSDHSCVAEVCTGLQILHI